MILFLYGADQYRLEKRLRVLRQAFAQKYGELNIVFLEGADLTSADELISHASAASLFGDKRLVVVKNILSEQKNKELLAALADQISSGLLSAKNDNILIFIETTDKLGNTRLAKLLKTQKAEAFNPLSGSQLNRFLHQLAQNLGITLVPAALNLLAANASALAEDGAPDLFHLENELKKLAAYKGRGLVAVEDVNEVCTKVITGHIFTFTDYLGQRQGQAAIQELAKLRASGEEEVFIFAMVAKHVRNLILVKDLQQQGMAPGEIVKITKLHPFVVKKALVQSKHFSVGDLALLSQRLYKIDYQQKSGELPLEAIALDQVVLEMSGL